MKENRPSITAALVAACRSGLGVELPAGTKLCDDPYGLWFLGLPETGLPGVASRWGCRAALLSGRVLRQVIWMQIRTRFLDDTLLEFVKGGGRQVVILGAGFDCRAIRFANELRGVSVFEVDHPATQARKKDTLARHHAPESPAKYIPLDFEKQSVNELPAILAAAGHDPKRPTLTIWEGVTMYLTEPAIEATAAAVRAYSSVGSPLAFTYFDFAKRPKAGAGMKLSAAFVRRAGEPWRFGWDQEKLPAWLQAHGFETRRNTNEFELSKVYLPAEQCGTIREMGRCIAIATVMPSV